MRYAKRSCTIDGKTYNQGDVVPEDVADVSTLEELTFTDEVPAKTAAEIRKETKAKTEAPVAETNSTDNQDSPDATKENDDSKVVFDSKVFDEAVAKGVIDFDSKVYTYGDVELGKTVEKAMKTIAKEGFEQDIIDSL